MCGLKFVKIMINKRKINILFPNLSNIEKLASKIIKKSKRPLFVMYYPSPGSSITESDIKDIRDEFYRNNIIWKKNKLEHLNVLIHTFGGSPGAAYKIAQLLRDFSNKITILVPHYSYSAGTLVCLSADEIRFGAQANLSPIDIHYNGEVELINIDYYMKFVKDCREQIEIMLRHLEEEFRINTKLKTSVDEILFSKLAEQLGTLKIGKYYRERTLTGHYAETLMYEYMFKNYPDKEERTDNIIGKLLFMSPAHDFQIDFHMAKEMKLPVFEMTSNEFQDTNLLIKILIKGFKNKEICKYIKEGHHLPFFRLYI